MPCLSTFRNDPTDLFFRDTHLILELWMAVFFHPHHAMRFILESGVWALFSFFCCLFLLVWQHRDSRLVLHIRRRTPACRTNSWFPLSLLFQSNTPMYIAVTGVMYSDRVPNLRKRVPSHLPGANLRDLFALSSKSCLHLLVLSQRSTDISNALSVYYSYNDLLCLHCSLYQLAMSSRGMTSRNASAV